MEALRRDIAAQEAELEQTRAERARMEEHERDLHDARSARLAADRRLAEVLASRSWHWTAPLRAGLDMLIAVKRWLPSGRRQ